MTTELKPTPGTEHIVQSGGAVLLRPPSRRAVRRRRSPRPVGVAALTMGLTRDLLARFAIRAQVVEAALFPALERATGQAEGRVRLDAPADEVSRTVEDLRAVFLRERDQGSLDTLIERHGKRVNTRTRDTFRRQFKAVMGVDVLSSEPWLAEEVAGFVTENVSLITSLEEESLADVEQLILRRVNAGDRPSQIAKQIRTQFETTETRARLIARDQTNKFHSRLLRRRYEGQGLKRYRWRTVRDPSVRDTHAALEGEVFEFEKPPVTVTTGKRAGERNNPGEDIQCRCFAEVLFEDLLPEE